ncbi:MAG: hypothetical protein Aureis2KO_17010 [Aureisphaera sp.]
MNLKVLAHNIISILVVVSILVPSVLPFMDCDSDILISFDISEDESKKKHKKELDEKEVFFQDLVQNSNFDEYLSYQLFKHYLESQIEVHQEILLPPPEHTI